MYPQQSAVNNRLLRVMSPADFGTLQPHLRSTPTYLRQVLIAQHTPIRQLFFPETGFCSITAEAAGNEVEVGMIGREGLVGASPILLDDDRSPHTHFIQAAGMVLSIGIDEFAAAVVGSVVLQKLLLRFVQTLLVQTSQTAFANATCTIEIRLARWLLMCQDRLQSDELAITHEFLSIMLGVQRTSVTLAMQMLEGDGLIRARRGRIEIRSRERLQMAAEDSYGLPEAEYLRLIGAG